MNMIKKNFFYLTSFYMIRYILVKKNDGTICDNGIRNNITSDTKRERERQREREREERTDQRLESCM